jgi:hypothetical protein
MRSRFSRPDSDSVLGALGGATAMRAGLALCHRWKVITLTPRARAMSPCVLPVSAALASSFHSLGRVSRSSNGIVNPCTMTEKANTPNAVTKISL